MGTTPTGRLVSDALDPVLVPAGFQTGQYGEGVDAQIIFCGGHDELSDRYPELPQARGTNDNEGFRERGGSRTARVCMDLSVDGVVNETHRK